MKNLLMIIGLVFCAQIASAQYFTLTSSGFLSNEKQNYMVVEMPGVKQKTLYKNVLNALSTMYKNPKEALSLVDGESITITGYEEEAITSKDKPGFAIGRVTNKYDLSYQLALQFKDGKIRINRPTFECRTWTIIGGAYNWMYLMLMKTKGENPYGYYIYDKKRELGNQGAYDELNKHFNALIKEILEKSKTGNDW